MQEKSKTVYLILGPKGVGKTTLGREIERVFGIRYVRTEQVAIDMYGRNINLTPERLKKIFSQVRLEIDQILKTDQKVCFDSTGVFAGFDELYDYLKMNYSVKVIRLVASEEVCLQRVKERDLQQHIHFSESETKEVFRKVERLVLKEDIVLNSQTNSLCELINELTVLLGKTQA